MSLDFEPIPKRFLVWEDEATDWICVPGTERDVWDLVDLLTYKTGLMRHKFHMKIVQSTNLFDTRGIEVFEGSIIRDEDEGYISVVEYRDGEYYGVDPYHNEIIDSLSAMKLCSEVIGHILSGPELLEDGNG